MSETAAAAPGAKKKGKGKLLMIVGAIVVLGGGVGAGLYAGPMLMGGHSKKAEGPEKPKLKVREGVDESVAEDYAEHPDKSPDPKLFQASYYPLKDNFTANLADSESYLQIGLGVSTYYGEEVVNHVSDNEMAVRSAVLMTLANQDSTVVTTPEGKVHLKQELKKAINDVLTQKEGFGGIDDVYFTSFVVQ